jgi:predicted nucleic acid-binding protein
MKLEHQPTLKRALNLFAGLQMEFEDYLYIAHMERQHLEEIYSYNRDFDKIGQVRWVVGQCLC